MSEAKHTPGPWAAHRYGDHDVADWTIAPDPGEEMSYVNSVAAVRYIPDGEGEANARLITAAPELLEALEELLASGACDFHAGNQAADDANCQICVATWKARAAIAKVHS